MAARAEQSTVVSPDAEQMLLAMASARKGTLALVAHLSDEQLEASHSPIMSPLVWDLAHIAAYEDLWLAGRHGGLELLRPDLAAVYDAFETPRALRADVELLDAPAAREYLARVRERSSAVILERGVGDGVLCELVLRHELQHCETMRQTLAIAGLLGAAERALRDAPLPAGEQREWVELAAGSFAMGAGPDGFAYDNERPRHTVELRAFAIARRPISNASWMRFSEGGGYERREWWSQEGWAWKQEYDITHHAAVAAGDPLAPVCHVSWFEADAYARAQGARLPTEAEWERAAGGELDGVGRVWEWTSSRFRGYPGFAAHPYREYSEVFFGGDYRVLRGGSWATHPRVASRTFRNWDLPQRRQIFSGVRVARDA